MQKQTRRFGIHPAMIFDVISRQAGTLPKAILESVMNSVDAGASHCAIEVNDREYRVIDDGKGFRDEGEIESFFETFGTPHTAGDAVYGRYRMGRGQGFSFGLSHWETGCFDMLVDIKNKGLDYELTIHESPIFSGCAIHNRLYQQLSPPDLSSTLRELRLLCEWIPIPVTLNGTLISKPLDQEKWDYTCEEFVIKRQGTGGVKLYNLGAFVREYNPWDFGGFSGIVISRKALEVNFARNDVLVQQCSVYKSIKKKLQELGGIERKKATRMTDEIRAAALREAFESRVVSRDTCFELKSIPLFPSRYTVLNSLKGRTIAVVSPCDDQRLADRLTQAHEITLVHSKLMWWLGIDPDDLCALETALNNMIEDGHLQNDRHLYGNSQIKVISFKEATQGMSCFYGVVQPRDVTPIQKAALSGIYHAMPYLVTLLRKNGHEVGHRRLEVGVSDSAYAWTDGKTRISYDADYLTRCAKSVGGYGALMATTLHELLHDDSDENTHVHDQDFYQGFHDLMMEPNYHHASMIAMARFNRVMANSNKGIPAEMARDIKRLFSAVTAADPGHQEENQAAA